MPKPNTDPEVVDPVVEEYKRHVDRAALRKNLKLSYEERFPQLMELQRFAKELQRFAKELQRFAKELREAGRKAKAR